jgi:recombinational DNA repair protein RecR
MPDFAAPVERLIDELKHLPGIGQKTAQRLAFYLLRAAPEDALALASKRSSSRRTPQPKAKPQRFTFPSY